jgi:hypothetical protein
MILRRPDHRAGTEFRAITAPILQAPPNRGVWAAGAQRPAVSTIQIRPKIRLSVNLQLDQLFAALGGF